MRIKSLDIGLESISTWTAADEVHLPLDGPSAPTFVPDPRPLDEVMRRPSLDERLPEMLRPDRVDAGLLAPAGIASAREAATRLFGVLAATGGTSRQLFLEAAAVLESDRAMDADVRTAVAAVLRG
jgi:hypothetical protein